LATAFLQDNLWDRAAGVLITSASITALGKFDRFRLHAGTPEDAVYTAVASPFDYQRGRLHIPAHLPEANQAQAHTDAIVEYLPTLFDLARGTLVLFASRRQMREVYEAFEADLQGLILMQDSQSKKALLDAHKAKIDAGDRSILFGLASFAEGVDLPAEYCEHVIIAKIPFAVPDDPREAALSEWIERGGGNAFREISVPDAGAKLLQACGRLLRTESDQGQISILDTRLLTKHYGRELLASLPPFARVTD
jgi:ATP-dependent DNA helicase DinG